MKVNLATNKYKLGESTKNLNIRHVKDCFSLLVNTNYSKFL